VVGKIVLYDMEERERVKIVDYQGSKNIDRTKIAEQLKEKGIELRLDSFLDENVLHRVDAVLSGMMAEKGFTNAEIKHAVMPVAGGPKLVNVTFTISEGPKLRIRNIEFVGNQAFSDRALARKMKDNKAKKGLIFMTLFRSATYKEDKYEEDAEKVSGFYREQGYVRARVGNPEVRTVRDEKDGKTRWIDLRIPVTEGPRYRVGDFKFEGNTVVKSDNLRPMFKMKEGDWYSEKMVRDGLKKAQEAYGAGGYMEFTGYPDLNPKNDGLAPVPTDGNSAQPAAATTASTSDGSNGSAPIKPTVDVTMRLSEGKQFFVNRISFVGNTTTRDNVIRREMRLVEGSVFNTESLKYSIRRLNQLGYFKQLEGNDKDMKVDKTAGRDNAVDVTLRVEEQNRNQVTFGAGVSQYEGFFGQLSFQTANFLGRGESLTASAQAGSRSQNYQLAFTEPFLFDRNLTGGVDVYKRSLQYIGYYTQKSTGRQHHLRFPRCRLRADVHQLLIRVGWRVRLERGAAGSVLYRVVARMQHDQRQQPVDDQPDRARTAAAQSVPLRLVSDRHQRQPYDQQGFAELRVQHDRQSDLSDQREACDAGDRHRRTRRQHELLEADARGHLVSPAHLAELLRRPGAVPIHCPVSRDDPAARLRTSVPRRRVQRARLRYPVDWTDGAELADRARGQQEPPLQRRIHHQHRRSRPPRAVL
jgi:outer membrane protein assembly factor BamA